MASKIITARQCKQARSLLKWNLHDITSKTNIPAKQLERFERSLTRLTMPESKEVITVFEKHGIVFLDNLDVILVTEESEQAQQIKSDLNQAKTIDAEEEGKDITFDQATERPKNDGMWVHTPEYVGPDRRTLKNQMHFSGDERRKERQNLVKRVLDKYKDK